VDIPFTEKQYSALLKIVFLGEWVANAQKSGMEDREIRGIEQYIYSFAEAFGANDRIAGDGKMYHPTRTMDEAVLPIVEEYDEEQFWDTLIEMLAERDLALEHGEQGVRKLDPQEYADQMEERASVYEEEFEEFGVSRLQILEEE
jgi:hypothetical protein